MPDLDPLSLPTSPPHLSFISCPNFVKPALDNSQNNSSLIVRADVNLNSMAANNQENRQVNVEEKMENKQVTVEEERKGEVEGSGKSESSSDGSDSTDRINEYLKQWVQRRIDAGMPESSCYLPFLIGSPKMAVCLLCQRSIYPKEELCCSYGSCQAAFHIKCAEEKFGSSSSKRFKCPQHACYLCKEKLNLWRCMRCPLANHSKCAAFPDYVIHFPDCPWQVICWRHNPDWRLEKQQSVPAKTVEEIFSRLPIPYNEEFNIDINWRDTVETKLEPLPYMHIKRNVYLVKKKKENIDADIGCTHCSSTGCEEDCVCRNQCISCSKACRCSEMCTNRPFRKEKKISIAKTALCGWGVVAAESINKGDFIIEYVGEVIDDAFCEQRLWDMKDKEVTNFYMCEIRKDFVIDATFKGNTSRFLNHSCNPNCKLEKWQVEGETRVGVFAAQSIRIGESLTYDYRFVQFGPEVKCNCGAANCQGYLGTKRKVTKVEDLRWGSKRKRVVVGDLRWGSKRKRTATSCLDIIIN